MNNNIKSTLIASFGGLLIVLIAAFAVHPSNFPAGNPPANVRNVSHVL